MTPIGAVVSELVDRGALPERLKVVRRMGPHQVGDVLVWHEDLRGYRGRAGWMMLAGVARDLFGLFLIQAPPVHKQQDLFAA